MFQRCGGSTGTGSRVGAVRGILQSRGVLSEDQGRLRHGADGEMLDEGVAKSADKFLLSSRSDVGCHYPRLISNQPK